MDSTVRVVFVTLLMNTLIVTVLIFSPGPCYYFEIGTDCLAISTVANYSCWDTAITITVGWVTSSIMSAIMVNTVFVIIVERGLG